MSIIGKEQPAQAANLDRAIFQKAIPEPRPFSGSRYFVPFSLSVLKMLENIKRTNREKERRHEKSM